MSNPTSSFGWQMPTSSDLVTDLPADFEVFGQAVDTSLADLKGGTTGQILSKASNTDMDFTWTAATSGDITGVTAGTGISGGGTSGDVTITNSMATAIDAKGDLIAGTAADTFSRLAIGSNNQVLTADSAEATGMKWAAVPTGGMTLISTTSLSGSSVSITSIPDTYNALYIIASGISLDGNNQVTATCNGSASSYAYTGTKLAGTNALFGAESASAIPASGSLNISGAGTNSSAFFFFPNYAIANTRKLYQLYASYNGQVDNIYLNLTGHFSSSSAISSFQLNASSGNFDGGTISVYGVK